MAMSLAFSFSEHKNTCCWLANRKGMWPEKMCCLSPNVSFGVQGNHVDQENGHYNSCGNNNNNNHRFRAITQVNLH